MFVKLSVVFLLCVSIINASLASEVVEWNTLQPDLPEKNIVLPELTKEQLGKIQEIFSLMHTHDRDTHSEIDKIKAELKQEGIDADEMFRIREEYMVQKQEEVESLNHQLDGKDIRMAGFLLPVAFKGDMVTTEFLLVPTAGACVHMPPPPANQIIRVSFPQGYSIKTVKEPIWVEGKLNANLHTENLHIVDGKRDITMGYSMVATNVTEL
ncbi:DUF3299 domain-containing protein [Thalassomonas sp. M1454]|uniref:DUF3299 domain-containing protein n=1 Tax=Thalassomonas sp. M1454 TaxID=2594477 RepID=UPI00117FA328|nr:DUF3299 domain-containing protein [Thalassomonas sp. M1454]TRX55706.1 DUF3299 domain-containing protein [Thalassomonas sp. M1454]